MNRYRLDISYDGTDYLGSQRQSRGQTVQGELEKSLKIIFKTKLETVFSGRTDAKVHALNQVVHVDTPFAIDAAALCKGLNSTLEKDIRVEKVECVPSKFHARFSAKLRTYHYYFSTEQIPVFLRNYITRVPYPCDLKRADGIDTLLLGKKDFKHFGSTGSNQVSTIRTIVDVQLTQTDYHPFFTTTQFPLYRLSITADSFLYHMVRNVMGALFEIMRGHYSIEEIKAMIENNQKIYYTTAKPHGLYLALVTY